MCCMCRQIGLSIAGILYTAQRLAQFLAMLGILLMLVLTIIVVLSVGIGLGYHYHIVKNSTHDLDFKDFLAFLHQRNKTATTSTTEATETTETTEATETTETTKATETTETTGTAEQILRASESWNGLWPHDEELTETWDVETSKPTDTLEPTETSEPRRRRRILFDGAVGDKADGDVQTPRL